MGSMVGKASWVNVTVGHDMETKCLGAVSDCPEKLVGNPGEKKQLCVAEPVTVHRPLDGIALICLDLASLATQAKKTAAFVHCFENRKCIKLTEPV